MRVLYTGAFRFPDGDAAASRVFAVSRLFVANGCAVEFAGWEKATTSDGRYSYQGHPCYSQSEFREEDLPPIRRVFSFLVRGRKTLSWLNKHRDYDVVVAYNPPAIFALALLFSGWRKGFRVVLDSTEWYESAHLPGGSFGIAALENWMRMRFVYRLYRHVICISSYLERYYHGRNVIKVPPLHIGLIRKEVSGLVDSEIRLIYAGQPGKKDRLVQFIKALPKISYRIGLPVKLHLVGVDDEWLRSMAKDNAIDLNVCDQFVLCHGRVDHAQVGALYSKSHYSVLFREHKRYALAGFPTKAVESWSYGCPIIGNAAGDLAALSMHMVDSIIIEESGEAELADALNQIHKADRYAEMSDRCLEKISKFFVIDQHLVKFDVFFRRLVA